MLLYKNCRHILIYTPNPHGLRHRRHIQHENLKSWCFKSSTPILSEGERSQTALENNLEEQIWPP